MTPFATLAFALAIIAVFIAVMWRLLTKPTEGLRQASAWLLAVSCLIALPVLAGGDLRTTLNRTTALHTRAIRVFEQPLAATNAFRTSLVITGLTVGTVISPTTAIAPGGMGRNVTVTQTNAGGSTNPVVTYRVECLDQFEVPWSEDIVANNTTLGVGTKVCQTFVRATPVAVAGVETGDTVVFGSGNVVGFPFQFSVDLREFQSLERVLAAGTTQTAVTINTTNIDTLNYACKATCFSASAVANGDTLNVLLRSDDRTQDDRLFPTR